jgi:L-ascorbate metabolism protein UlaG (beta-lactamase superfamily)
MKTNRRFFFKTVLGSLTFSSSCVKSHTIEYINNPTLKTIKKRFIGNKVINGKFVDLRSRCKNVWDIVKWRTSSASRPLTRSKKKVISTKQLSGLPRTRSDYIYWLGHATFLIQMNGIKILTDPCLTSPPLTRRHTPSPILAKYIHPDYLLISHGHFDHLDRDTIKHFHHSIALIPLRMSKIIKEINPTISTQEAGWFQKYDLDDNIKIYFLPALHWYRRSLIDINEILWGSFVIQTPKHTIFFAGDTGYAEHFQDIGKLFDIDLAILPIGAYSPRWLTKDQHMDPQDALRAFKDLKAKRMIPMHFGTFHLSEEPLDEPEKRLRKIAKREKITYLSVGEKWML